jgi:gluconolactonase
MAQVEKNAEKIAGGFHATAGPVFSRRGYLLFSDVTANRILKWEKGKVTVLRENSRGAKSNTFDHQGRLLTCETGQVTRTEKDGKITVLASGLKEPADVVYAIDGSVYFTDPSAGIVYQRTRNGDTRPVSRDCESPFGVALAPNQQHLFVTDGARRQVRVFEVKGDGSLANGRVFAAFEDQPGGLKTDESGGVWIAGSAGVHHLDKAGAKLETITLPEPSGNINWGEGFQDLYMTAGTSVYYVRAGVKGTRTY